MPPGLHTSELNLSILHSEEGDAQEIYCQHIAKIFEFFQFLQCAQRKNALRAKIQRYSRMINGMTLDQNGWIHGIISRITTRQYNTLLEFRFASRNCNLCADDRIMSMTVSVVISRSESLQHFITK